MPVQFNIHGPMILSSGDAAERTYKAYVGKSGKTWCVADQESAADNIYVDGGPNSRGMAGRTLTFKLSDGGEIQLQGPWKTGAGELYKDTGVDIRDAYFTRGVVSRHRINGKTFYAPDFYVGVLHYDDQPVLGAYNRVDRIAQRIADDLGEPVFMAVTSKGGGCAKRISPRQPAKDTGEK
tara:strand:- start:137 stop:676 length:540 start_codon:yes stop_codon:yes gene_type:complete